MKGEAKLRKQLSPMQDVIFALLRLGDDVLIEDMFKRLYNDKRNPTQRQQAVGAHISRMNVKLAEFGYIVRPGKARRTYRVYPIHAAPRKVHGRKAVRR